MKTGELKALKLKIVYLAINIFVISILMENYPI